MVRTFLKVYMELDSYFLFLQEQIKDIIIAPPALSKVWGETGAEDAGMTWITSIGSISISAHKYQTDWQKYYPL